MIGKSYCIVFYQLDFEKYLGTYFQDLKYMSASAYLQNGLNIKTHRPTTACDTWTEMSFPAWKLENTLAQGTCFEFFTKSIAWVTWIFQNGASRDFHEVTVNRYICRTLDKLKGQPKCHFFPVFLGIYWLLKFFIWYKIWFKVSFSICING